MRNLSNQDIEFLKNLQHEMLTQDKVCQASPIFWVVAQYEKIPTSEHTIQRNTFFLTLRECKEHIQRNHYHYNKTVHSYAMTAWRSPQVEKLYEILENVDFSKLMKEGESDEPL